MYSLIDVYCSLYQYCSYVHPIYVYKSSESLITFWSPLSCQSAIRILSVQSGYLEFSLVAASTEIPKWAPILHNLSCGPTSIYGPSPYQHQYYGPSPYQHQYLWSQSIPAPVPMVPSPYQHQYLWPQSIPAPVLKVPVHTSTST